MPASPSALAAAPRRNPTIEYAPVVANTRLCRDHYRLTLRVGAWTGAEPGQFVQLSRAPQRRSATGPLEHLAGMPLLPRAFSVGGLRAAEGGWDVDVIYRVVGIATAWMEALAPGEPVTVLGPLGREFPIDPGCRRALLVIGGVGLPPLLFLAERLQRAGVACTALLGAQRAEFIPLDLIAGVPPATDAARAVVCAREFAEVAAPMVISTDDGSLGYRGTVVDALAALAAAQPFDPADTVVYTCGPERMMRATADWCEHAGIPCWVCMERPMACGLGTCQSCIVPVRDDEAARGRRYALCCSEGPVFAAESVLWDER